MNKLIDSDVIVFAFSNNPKKEVCRELIENEKITVNTLILLESFSKVATITKDKELAIGMVKLFYQADNIEIVNFDINLFFEALKRSGKSNLKISDLVHYTTALLKGCSAIVSYDHDFDDLGIKRIEP
ncbi:MAG: PIN domain-containing protein [Nanoarchaeota archaeon]|nr:PIN domain-containing protein [Nanoarchaeota archaeon]MBU1005476.1 PIN domain-containing protein [Nanoarchaeota archaeon]MBU1947046.1 PIN domain-containing protein [Nanoarchaeota archaeon]